MRLCHQAV